MCGTVAVGAVPILPRPVVWHKLGFPIIPHPADPTAVLVRDRVGGGWMAVPRIAGMGVKWDDEGTHF